MTRSGASLLVSLLALGCLGDPASYAGGGGGGGGGAAPNGGQPATGAGAPEGGGGSGPLGGEGGAPTLNVDWVLPLGTPAEQLLTSLAVSANGTVFVGGQWGGAFEQTPVNGDCQGADHGYVQAVTANGEASWVHCFGGAATVEAVDVNDDGYVAVAGSFENGINVGNGVENSKGARDVFVALLDPDGGTVWGATYGGTGDDRGMGVAIDDDGIVYVSGSYHATVSFGGDQVTADTGASLFLAKIDSGTATWAHQLDNEGVAPTMVIAVRRGAAGPIVATGSFEGSLDADGPGPDQPIPSESESDAFVIGFNAAGTPLYYKPIAGGGRQEGRAIQTSDDAFVVSGTFVGAVPLQGKTLESPEHLSAFALTYDYGGALLAADMVGGSGTTRGLAVGLDRQGGVGKCVGGNFDGELSLSTDGGSAEPDAVDAFLQCFEDERPTTAIAFGSAGGVQTIHGAAKLGTSILIAGDFASELELGEGFTAKGLDDVFVAKLSPPE